MEVLYLSEFYIKKTEKKKTKLALFRKVLILLTQTVFTQHIHMFNILQKSVKNLTNKTAGAKLSFRLKDTEPRENFKVSKWVLSFTVNLHGSSL